eukprot:c24352_g1_i1 orf=252-1745(+)
MAKNRAVHAWTMRIFYTAYTMWVILGCTQGLGVNWGTQTSHPLPSKTMVQLFKNNNIQKVKLFDSNSSALMALAGSGIQVMVGIPNDLLGVITDAKEAQIWVQNNVVRYMFAGGVNIKYVAVGNEPFLTTYNDTFTDVTYPALQNIQKALNNANLGEQVKATVPLNADVLSTSSVPSGGAFRPDISELMKQIVSVMYENNCPFTINIYPFISLYNDKNFPMDYAFFDGTATPIQDGSNTYRNVFDASYDTLVAALEKLGYPNMQIIVGEIGWPTDGDVNANIQYAEKFNQGLLNHALSNVGTPLRPNMPIDFYLFSLIDEDQKSIAPGNFERHWGVFRYDGQAKYPLSFTGSGRNVIASTGVNYLPQRWCVLNTNADTSNLGDSITYACTNSDCTALGYGCSCNPYLDLKGNASYAFNQYYQRNNQGSGTCFFGGLGQLTTQNPSVGNCVFMVQVAYSPVPISKSNICLTNNVSVMLIVLVAALLFLLGVSLEISFF